MYKFLNLKSANDGKHKYQITLEHIPTGKQHTVKFGGHGYDDFTLSRNTKKREDYILRHKVREDWNDPLKPGTLSRYILWNKPTLLLSLQDYLKRFNISSKWG